MNLDFSRPPAWTEQALCAQVDAELFFPETGLTSRTARSVCRRCDVRTDCLAYAIDNGIREGVWGGMSERQRRPLVTALKEVA